MSLPTSTPLDHGIDPAGLLAFLDGVRDDDGLELHGLAVARHGHVVARGGADPYTVDRVQLVYSLSKVLTTTAIAFLWQDGRLGLDDPVVDHLGDLVPADVDPRWRGVSIRHCLTMTVGHEVDAWAAVMDRSDPAALGARGDWVARALAVPPTAAPGSVFAYNQVATYLLSVVVAHLAGGVRAMLRPRLLDPLGIGEVPWQTDPQGREQGFSGAHLATDDVLALAQFVLDRGTWQGQRLLDEAWFDAGTVAFGPIDGDPDTSVDWRRGYGFAFWMQEHGFRGDGAFGQFLCVLPDKDLAIAITSEQVHMQATLDLLWAHVVPAVDRPGTTADQEALGRALDELAVAPLANIADVSDEVTTTRSPASDLGPAWTGAAVRPREDGHILELVRAGEALVVAVGDGTWVSSVLRSGGWTLPVVASGGWVDRETFVAEVRVIETPHTFRATVHRSAGPVDLAWRMMPLTGPDPFGLAVRRDADIDADGDADQPGVTGRRGNSRGSCR